MSESATLILGGSFTIENFFHVTKKTISGSGDCPREGCYRCRPEENFAYCPRCRTKMGGTVTDYQIHEKWKEYYTGPEHPDELHPSDINEFTFSSPLHPTVVLTGCFPLHEDDETIYIGLHLGWADHTREVYTWTKEQIDFDKIGEILRYLGLDTDVQLHLLWEYQ